MIQLKGNSLNLMIALQINQLVFFFSLFFDLGKNNWFTVLYLFKFTEIFLDFALLIRKNKNNLKGVVLGSYDENLNVKKINNEKNC